MIEKIFGGIFSVFTVIIGVWALGVMALVSLFIPATEYPFMHSQDDIVAISVVSMYGDENNEIITDEINVIDDIPMFIEDLRLVTCKFKFGDPASANDNLAVPLSVIKITYGNGDYELIGRFGQSTYVESEDEFSYYAGFYTFDREEFDDLIEKYSA